MSEKIRDVDLKVTATQDVHIREKTPELKTDNRKGVIYKGFTVDVVEEWRGDAYPDTNNNIWYRDRNGDFLWSGGFKQQTTTVARPELIRLNYNEALSNIPSDYRQTKGEGVTVVVIDSGVQISHEAFMGSIEQTFCITGPNDPVTDVRNHGTHITGIIGARNNSLQDGMIGVAPKCKLVVCKVSDDERILPSSLKKAMKWIDSNIDAQVINMSFGVDRNSSTSAGDPELDELLQKFNQKGVIQVCSASNDDMLSKKLERLFLYPARNEHCVSVGCLSKEAFPRLRKNLSDYIQFILPFEKMYSCINENGKFDSFPGSSMSTALVSGIAALFAAKEQENTSTDSFRKFMRDIASPVSNTSYEDNPLKIYQNENARSFI